MCVDGVPGLELVRDVGSVFFKQKTAYELRISDWSSDVCSSDLPQIGLVGDSQASNMRGRFVSGFDASRRRLTGTAGQRRFYAFAGGYDALGNPTGGVGPASNRGGSAGGKKSGGSSSAKRAKTQVDEAAKAADELKRNLDSILASLDPKAAQMQSLLEKGRDLEDRKSTRLNSSHQ